MLGLLLSIVALDAPPPDALVVSPPAFLAALEPWVRYREAQGHRFAFIDAGLPADSIREEIRARAGSGLRSVVLVGDTAPVSAAGRQQGPPAHLAASTVTVRWGSEPEIATDNWYVDLDDDQLPDLAVGRIPADSPAQVEMLVRRVLAYESTPANGDWQRRLNFIAGVGGFGAIADAVLESATKKFLTDGIPAEFSVSMTYGSWRSPFCPDPRAFRETVIERFNEGCLFWVYIGHGDRTVLDRIRVPGASFPILDTDDVPKLNSRLRPPIAVFLSCYAGAFDEHRDCLAEEMMVSPGGPVAALAGSRVTMPYAMAVLGNELMAGYFRDRRATIGELVLHAKRSLATTADDAAVDNNRRLLDALAKAISPAADQLDAERLEHVLLFNLLGDPLLRLPYPRRIEVATPPSVIAGESLTLTWQRPLVGTATLELVCRRDRRRAATPLRTRFQPTDDSLAAYSDVYRTSNDRRWLTQQLTFAEPTNSAVIAVPPDARGPSFARIFVEGHEQSAAGASPVFVRRPPPQPPSP